MTVQRGGSTWKPSVTPVGTLPRSQPLSNNVSPVTKTSLAAQKQDYTPIGASHNMSPKGFSSTPHVNGDAPKLVNKQYNSPIGLYSEQSIAETLSAQAEVLSTGALGVNFKKNEKNYDAEKSEVYKMLQEAEREPRTPEPATETDSGVVSAPATTAVAGLRHVTAPIDRPQPQAPAAAPANTQLPPGQNICADCERLIVGVFVRIKDKNLHVECFKCATCGTSLKNVGYYNINNKLYCDIHAKLAARSNPPAPNMVPVTIPPGGKVPAGTISAALASHSLPSPSPLSPSGNQVAAPFSPHSKQDSLERNSQNNNHNPKVDAVANLMSALTMAAQKEYKENGTNTDTVYLTEKIIPINNSYNNNDNNGVKEEQFPSPPPPVKYMPYRPKSASSFTGPKPFSSMQPSTPSHAPFTSVQPSTPVAAPIAAPLSNTLPRTGPAAPLPERKEWPPSKSEEIPTASPLYIDPSSRNPTPQPKVSNPHHTYIPVAQNPLPQITNPHNAVPQITISQNTHPVMAINETNISKSQVEELSSEYKSTQEIRNISQNIDRNMSICSAEVTNITGRKSVTECVETVSSAVDTQMLVNHVTKLKERPKSPPPLHRKDSVYDTQDISIVVSTKTPGGKNPTTGNPVITVDDKSKVNIEDVVHSSCNPGNPGNPNICKGNPVSNPCPMSDPDCTVKIVTCPQSNPVCPINVQQNMQSTTNVQDTSNMSQKVTSSKVITNPVPQQYISPMVKALTIASDRPFNTVSVEIKSKEYGIGRAQKEIIQTTSSASTSSMQAKKEVKIMQESKASQQNIAMQESKALKHSTAMQNINVASKQESTFPHIRAPVAASPLASALTIAPSKPFTPIPQFSMDPVTLPPETTPYFPPEHPVTIEPKVQVQQPVACKSPFVQALTTASDRPYTPLAGTGQEQSDVPDFMKDIPAPSRQKMSMLTALTTASERPFTPALSVGSIEDILLKPTEPPKPQHKPIPAPPPMPITVKPASHTSPSAFRPIGNSMFKPITQSYKPQAPELPKVVTSFPPISNELKSTYAPSTGFSYSTPSKIASQQTPIAIQPVQQTSHIATQQQMTQYAGQIKQEAQIQQTRKQSVNAGLQAPSNIPSYQKNIKQRVVETQQMVVPQIQVPIQKPITTLQPGQYQPNNHLQTFQPVMDENHKHYMRTNSPLPRAISPSMINHPAPPIPYYQADLVAHECAAVETNVFDPRSPAISRSPSPCPGARSTSPFPRTMTKSPAQGPPPNPLADRIPKIQPVRSEKYLEAKQNLSTYIPKYQGKDDQVKSHLSTSQAVQSKPRQFTAQSQFSTGQSQVVSGQSQFLGGHAQIATQSESYQNIQMGHSERQQQSQLYRMSEVENVRHVDQLNKSQMQSVETSADNRIQIQRTKRCTEEYERTQKEKTIEILRTGSGQTQIRQGGSSVGAASSIGFQRQTSLTHPTIQKTPAKPVTPAANARSYSLPGAPALGPKQFKPSPLATTTPKAPFGSQSASRPNVPQPYAGGAGAGAGGSTGRQSGAIGVAPKRGRGVLNLASAPGSRVPMCGHCNMHIRGPFITALGKIWCPEHFICTTPSCRRPLQDMGFVEEKGQLYCEFCFEQYLAPICAKCNSKIKGDCLNAIGKHFHPECFACAYCSKLFGNSPFFLEDGLPYCEADWNELFTTKCFACGFPVEAGDRWVEALNNNYHSQCFNCTMCKKNLEGQSFYAKGGRPFCKNHAR